MTVLLTLNRFNVSHYMLVELVDVLILTVISCAEDASALWLRRSARALLIYSDY